LKKEEKKDEKNEKKDEKKDQLDYIHQREKTTNK